MATAIMNEGIEVVFRLPYSLVLPEGEYFISPRRHTLQMTHPEVLEYTSAGEAVIEALFNQEAKRCIGITLSAVNRLIQWYRFHTQHAQAIELQKEQVSPILLFRVQGEERQTYAYEYSQPARRPQQPTSEQLNQLNLDFLQRRGPPTEHLLLLDAQEALKEFRHREAVLLAWSAIETRLGPFLRAKLLESLPDLNFDRDGAGANFERDLHFLTCVDALLQLLTGFSFRTDITPEFWNQLRTSRNHRNSVVHRGGDADESEARLAVEVAKVFVNQIDRLSHSPSASSGF
jgi:hypothetical protein